MEEPKYLSVLHAYLCAFLPFDFELHNDIMNKDHAEKRDYMTPIEILNKIVEAESSAREVYDEAEKLRANFDEYVEAKLVKIREEYAARAEKEIEEARAKETARADEEIRKLSDGLRAELETARKRYEQEKDADVLKIFKLAVAADA